MPHWDEWWWLTGIIAVDTFGLYGQEEERMECLRSLHRARTGRPAVRALRAHRHPGQLRELPGQATPDPRPRPPPPLHQARVRVHRYPDARLAVFHGPRKPADWSSTACSTRRAPGQTRLAERRLPRHDPGRDVDRNVSDPRLVVTAGWLRTPAQGDPIGIKCAVEQWKPPQQP